MVLVLSVVVVRDVRHVTIFNPRRACAERVTVVVLCVCLSVCLNTLFWQYTQLEV